MSTLNRKLLRELYRAKGMLLAVTSIIAVGIMCYVSMQSAYNNLAAAKERYYRRCRMADFWIDVKKVPLAEIDAVARLPGITDVHDLGPRVIDEFGIGNRDRRADRLKTSEYGSCDEPVNDDTREDNRQLYG